MQFKQQSLDLSRPQIMGILNVTPDSFSDGGRFACVDAALSQAETMVSQGASIIDVGGESTRPGATEVTEQQELDRVIPVIQALATRLDCIISIDTSKAAVMCEAVGAGAGLINDVRALQMPDALDAAARLKVPVCLMHMQGQPQTMQQQPQYYDVVTEVMTFFKERIEVCQQAGINTQNIILDPGFGFGKSLQHNLRLLAHLAKFSSFGLPLLVGLSRKSMFEHLLGLGVNDRQGVSVQAAAYASSQGANILRVHDVKATADALQLLEAIHTHL